MTKITEVRCLVGDIGAGNVGGGFKGFMGLKGKIEFTTRHFKNLGDLRRLEALISLHSSDHPEYSAHFFEEIHCNIAHSNFLAVLMQSVKTPITRGSYARGRVVPSDQELVTCCGD